MELHEPMYVWLWWSLTLLAIWAIFFTVLKDESGRHRMMIVSAWSSFLGLTEPLFVPEYWSPPSLFDLAHSTGFDIESFIFSFAAAGIAVALYERMFPSRGAPKMFSAGDTWRRRAGWLVVPPLFFLLLYAFTDMNVIYSAVLAMVAAGIMIVYMYSNLKIQMIISACAFGVMYFFWFLLLVVVYPGYIEQVWNLPVLSGVFIAGVPVEELLFAFSFGFLWSGLYEIVWRGGYADLYHDRIGRVLGGGWRYLWKFRACDILQGR